MNILHSIGAGIATIGLFIAGLFGYSPVQEQTPTDNLGVALPSGTANFETALATGITDTATTMTLTSVALRGGGTLSGYQCFTIDEGSAQAEFVCGTASGTAVSSLERGISPADGITEDDDLKFSHRRGASVKITDFPLLQRLVFQNSGASSFANTLSYETAVAIATSSNNIPYASWVQQAITTQSLLLTTDQTASGNKTFSGNFAVGGTLGVSGSSTLATTTSTSFTIASGTVTKTPTTDLDIANKAYVDSIAFLGAPDASDTVKGIVEEATQAEIDNGTTTGDTGAKLFIPVDKVFRTAQTVIPQAPIAGTNQISGDNITGNTTAKVGQVFVPFKITATKISLYCSVMSAGTLDISFFSEDGQTRYFSTTTGTIGGTGLVTVTIPSTVILPGNYYVMINPNSTANIISYFYSMQGGEHLPGLANSITSEPKLGGTLAITADTPPTTFSPTGITGGTSAGLIFRIDN